jgi:hypothetical protein
MPGGHSRRPFRIPGDSANASAPARTASGSTNATSGGCGSSAASTTRPERCDRVVEPSRPSESHTLPSGRSLNQGGAPSPPKTARRPAWAEAWPLRVVRPAPSLNALHWWQRATTRCRRRIAPDPTRRRALNRWGVAHGGGVQGPARRLPPLLAAQGATDGPPPFCVAGDSPTPNEQGRRPLRRGGHGWLPRTPAYGTPQPHRFRKRVPAGGLDATSMRPRHPMRGPATGCEADGRLSTDTRRSRRLQGSS